MCYICVIKHDKQKMEIVLKLYTYVDGVNDTPFPNEKEQAMFTFTYEANRMAGSPTITATVRHRLCLDDLWTDNVYAMFNGVRYYIMNTPSSSKDNEDARYEHDLELMSEREILNHVYFIDAVQGDSSVDQPKSNTATVQFFGDVNEFAGRLNACFQYQKLNYTAVVDEGVESEDRQVSFEDKYILEALQEIYNVYEIPYYFVGNVVHIGYSENTVTYPLKYGFDEALLSISKENANYALINKIKGQGSSDNIPYYYPNNSPKGDIGVRIISGPMVVSNFIIYDYEKFASNMSTTDTCTVRQVTGESGVISFVWSMNGKDIELSDIGIRLAGGAVPKAGSRFGQSIESYITPSDRLMPSIYRETKGAEQFYEAKNNTYSDGEGGYYHFENEYSEKNPRQGTTDFEDIKPTIKEMTNASGQRIDMFTAFAYDLNDNDETDEEGNYLHPYFFAKLRKFDGENGFNLFDQAIEGQTMTISFTSGACGACSFEIGVGEETEKNIVQVDDNGNLKRDSNGNVLWENQTPQDRQNDTSKYEVWIALKKDDSTYSYIMPNVTQNIKPSTSDTFVILGINLPTAYITAAEKRLEQSLIKYMWMNNTEKFTFSIKFSRIFFTEHPDVLEQLNENSRVLVEYNGQQHTLYVDSFTYKTDESSPLPEITVDLVDTLSIGQNSLQTQLDSVKQDVLSSIGGGDFLKQGLKYFIRKDIADTAQGKITFNSGLQSKGDVIIGKNGFAGGLAGFGAKIGSDGRAEMRALTLWEFLEVPELRFNSVKVFLGIDWQVAGAGIIESCTPDTDEEGNQLTTGTCTLKLEEGQYGAVDVDDIALGIWHFGNSNDATEDTDDGKGGFTFAGFATAYFRITEVSGANNETFKYSLRPGFTIHPQSQMTFACYGNFTNEERQTSTYRTRTYTRRLCKQNTWEIGAQNIAMQEGDLSNLSIFGIDMTGYSMYINSVYFTGTITQVKPDGTPVKTANDRGEWLNNTKYDYYDRVSHNGCIWLCVDEDGTDTEPTENNPSWLLQVSKGEAGQDGTSFKILGSKNDESELPQEGNQVGDAYLINGDIWVWTEEGSWKNVGNIQGPAGESVQNMGGWYSGLFVPYLGVVRMGKGSFMCVAKNGTYNPPYYTLLDNSGNRIKTNDGYILTGEINNAEYQLIAVDGADGQNGMDGVPGKDGADGKTYYTWIRYADDAEGNGISNDPTGKSFIGFAYNKETPLESNNPSDYMWSDIKGEQGVPGAVGADGKTYYTWIAYSDNPDGNPMYQQPKDSTKYIGIAVNKETSVEGTYPSEYTWSKFKGEDGKDGLNGADGVDGKDGTSIIWKGEFASAPSNPQNGWAYKNTSDKKSYVYQDGAWYQMTIDGVDGQNGKDGISIVWKGDLSTPPQKPQTNWAYRDTDNGRVYIYNGSSWELMVVDGTDGVDGAKGEDGFSVYITYNDSDTEPSKPTGNGTTCGWHTEATSTAIWMSQKVAASSTEGTWGNPIKIKGETGSQGEKGDGFSLMGQWYDGMLVPYMGVVLMGGNSFAAKVATTNPPMFTLLDNSGRRLKSESGYILTGEINTAEYTLIAEKGQDGLDGLQGVDGKDGIPGKDGADGKTSYFHIKYSENENGYPMTETPSTYIGTYVDFTEQDSDDYTKYAWARFEGVQGEKGEQGIPGYNGADGKTYYLHIKYSNDGGSTFTGNNGETPGDYIGVYTDTNPNDSNDTSDYTWSKTKGDKGDKGDQGDQGDGFSLMGQWYDGMLVPYMGVVLMGGNSFAAKVATTNPPMWTILDNQGRRIKSNKGYILTGGINTAEYDVWAEKGEQGDKGETGDKGDKGDKGDTGAQGKQGIDGCIVRDSEWAIGTEYRNDSNITDGSLEVRYIDIVLVRNDAVDTGWDAYRCKLTHLASTSITYKNTSYWEKFSTNVGTIFTSLIIAKNAKINFLQGNQLLIQKTDGTVTAGLSGSNEGEKVRFWAGSPTPDNSPFSVTEEGVLNATKAYIEGTLKAGSVGDFTINKGISNVSNNPEAFIQIEKNGGKFFRVNTISSSGMCAIRADSATALEISTYGSSSSSIGISVTSNASGYGYAIKSNGNVLLNARQSEHVEIKGLTINVRKVSSSGSLYSNDDFIEFNNARSITFNMTSNAVTGKVVYLKKITSGADVTLTGRFRNPGDVGTSTSGKIGDEVSRMFVFDGTYWTQFYCG